jgi:peptidoglycan/xylan/chitin deacetylase (PgdA/CDA1 family)
MEAGAKMTGRRVARVGAMVCAAGLVAAAVTGAGAAARGPARLGPAIRWFRTETKVVALTFDDGPVADGTPQVLAILKKHGVKATFFFIGKLVDADPALARRVAAEGHEIGNHTYNHTHLTAAEEPIVQEIARGAQALRKALGQSPTIFRPPGTHSKAEVIVESAHVDHVVLWSIDTRDWSNTKGAGLVEKVVSQAHPGAVILMHDYCYAKASHSDALDAIITRLKRLGYSFMTVGQLINLELLETGEGP